MTDQNNFIHPSNTLWGHCCNLLLRTKSFAALRRSLLARLPYLKLRSNTCNIVYLNWLVNLDAFEDLIPQGISLEEKNGRALFSILTYQHGHFGPSFLGPLRSIFPSPLQSNWRFYLSKDTQIGYEHLARAQKPGVVLFVKNILNSTSYTLGSRLFSDGLPAHLAQTFQHTHSTNTYLTNICAGIGSAPELFVCCEKQENKELPPEFKAWFNDWDTALSYLCPQHSAIAYVPSIDRVAHAGIALPIKSGEAQALHVKQLKLPFLSRERANPSEPLAFVIPDVQLDVLWEHVL